MNSGIFDTNDTITALSTSPGTGAIAVIRVSGSKTFSICNQILFSTKGSSLDLHECGSHTVHLCWVKDDEAQIDEVVFTIFKAPNSYTGEDVVEISCHGSVFIQQEILSLLVRHGARMAQPGEFTFRAFMNGRMDLSQAEAVADLIATETRLGHDVALRQMRGGFSGEINLLREKLVDFASLIELELDFSEEDVEFADRNMLNQLIIYILEKINQLIKSFSYGNAIRHGVPVVIAGKPNAGKSTLLNILLKEERAIVSPIPGTTRDTIEDVITIDGIQFRFIDTAGIRETSDSIEAEGVFRTYEKINQASVILYIFDISEISSDELISIVAEMKKGFGISDKPILLIGNKIDTSTELGSTALTDRASTELSDLRLYRDKFAGIPGIIFISAKLKYNINQITESLTGWVNEQKLSSGDTVVTNVRHLEALTRTRDSLLQVKEGLNQNLSGDLLSVHLRGALQELGEITGTITSDDLLANIFGKFCIGQ